MSGHAGSESSAEQPEPPAEYPAAQNPPVGLNIASAHRATIASVVAPKDIPRRILVEDPKTAGDDERECEVEGWFQTDDGVPVSSALRPLSVACARPWGHAGHHRSKPRRAYFRSGRVWVYEWGIPEDSPDG